MSSVSGSSAAPQVAAAAGFGPGALLTPANLLTLARIGATPPFLWYLTRHPEGGWVPWLCWFALCATDLVDGRVARRQGATRSGAFLDPLADKVLVLGAFAVLVAIDRVWWLPALLIAAREVGMSWYRSWIGRRGVSVPANKVAKVKTCIQCVAIGLVILPATAPHPLVYGAMIWLAVLFTLATGLQYAIEGRRLAASNPATTA